jgi:hypothetical protein
VEWWGWVTAVSGWVFGAAGLWFGFRADRRAERKYRQEVAAEDLPPWGMPEFVSGSLYLFPNRSQRRVVVTAVRADDARMQNLVRPRSEMPTWVDPGGALRVMVESRLSITPTPVIVWRWEGESADRARETRSAVN